MDEGSNSNNQSFKKTKYYVDYKNESFSNEDNSNNINTIPSANSNKIGYFHYRKNLFSKNSEQAPFPAENDKAYFFLFYE